MEIGTTRRLRLELYQPLGPGSALFLAPYTQARVSPTDQYLDGRVVTRYETETRAGGAALGVELGHWADARVGIERGHVNARPRIGEPGRPSIHAELGRVYAQLEVNWLDDPLFPRSGMAAGVLFRSERADLGATHAHQRLLLDVLKPVTIGRVTVVTGAVAGTALRGALPAHEPFGLGGFLMMTGYPAGELVGSHMLLGRVIVFRDLVPDRVFAGVAFEGGNTWVTRDAVSPGDLRYSVAPMAGFRTPIGPLYLGYGFGEGGRRQATVSIGRSATPRDYFP